MRNDSELSVEESSDTAQQVVVSFLDNGVFEIFRNRNRLYKSIVSIITSNEEEAEAPREAKERVERFRELLAKEEYAEEDFGFRVVNGTYFFYRQARAVVYRDTDRYYCFDEFPVSMGVPWKDGKIEKISMKNPLYHPRTFADVKHPLVCPHEVSGRYGGRLIDIITRSEGVSIAMIERELLRCRTNAERADTLMGLAVDSVERGVTIYAPPYRRLSDCVEAVTKEQALEFAVKKEGRFSGFVNYRQ